MHSNLTLRILSILVLAPVVIGAIWFGDPVYNCLLAVLGAGLAWEWEQMILKRNTVSGIIMATAASITAFVLPINSVLAFLTILVAAVWVYWRSHCNISLAFGTLYICFPVAAMAYIYYISGQHYNAVPPKEIIYWLLFVVWATDIGGYVVGKTVGGPKLCPKISAKKTWAGLFGAIGFAMAVAYFFALYLKANEYAVTKAVPFDRLQWVLVLSAGLLAIVSQVGDFFESFIKRKLGLKDSSNIIPGHGGLFDRVDGLLFAAMFTAVALYFLNLWIM